MDKLEATPILRKHLARYRKRAYADLRTLLDQEETLEVVADSGKWYQLEFQILWDDRPDGNLRVIGSIDDGGVRAFFPLTESIIMTPDGSLVGNNSS